MNTEVLPVSNESIDKAAAILRDGGVVAFPTETVYGLGANGLDADAVARIFAAKGRPQDNPLIQHVSAAHEVARLVRCVPPEAKALMDAFWPGPLSIILEAGDTVPENARAGLPTVAVRCPGNIWARALIARCGVPIAAPSANRSGRPSPTTAGAVYEDMRGRIPLILDGGPCVVGLESTVVTLCADTPRILRPGGVTQEQMAAVIGPVGVDETALRALAPGEKAASPGMMHRHYAPNAALTVVGGEIKTVAERIGMLYDSVVCAGGNPAVLARLEHAALYGGRAVYALGTDGSVEGVGAALYDALRKIDADGRTDVFAEAVEPRGIGLAVMNRLLRAAGFRFINT